MQLVQLELLAARLRGIRAVRASSCLDAYLFSNDPMHAAPWNLDWTSHEVSELAAAAGVKLNITGLRHYIASQLLAARFDLRKTAARLGHSGGGATTLRHYAGAVRRPRDCVRPMAG